MRPIYEGQRPALLKQHSSSDLVIEGVGRGWLEFLPLASLTDLDGFDLEFRTRFERKETSLSLKPCSDPNLHVDMAELLRDGGKSDSVIVIGESKIFVHKEILKKRSDYFRAMFSSGLKESGEKEIKIEADEKLFRILLRFWYSGKRPDDIASVAWDLLEAAHCFQVKSIVDQCEFSIRANLKVDQAVDALVKADRLGCATLKKACLDLIAKNLKELHDTEKFAELKKDPELMFEVLHACGAAS